MTESKFDNAKTKTRKYMYEVIDRQTKYVISVHKTLKSANRKVDKLDNIYGGYRYFAQKQGMMS